jgi:hypothetical protein
MVIDEKVVATGVWYYDGTVPKRITICARLAKFAGSRYDADDRLDDTMPVPDTPDGLVYRCWQAEGRKTP